MKKQILFFTLFFVSTYGFAQQYLTNGQVYNFNVGDAFEYKMGNTSYSTPPNYYLDSIIAKSFSAAGDTIYYTEIEYSFTPPSCPPPCTGSSSGPYINNFSITNLDSVASFDTTGNDCPTKDTLYTDSVDEFCGKRIYKNYPDPACIDTENTFDWNRTWSWDIEGCGGGYLDNSTESGGVYNHLVFFRKHDTTCGSEYVITGINNINSPVYSFTLYPNPASTQVTLTYQLPQAQTNAVLKLYNAVGQLVKSTALKAGRGNVNENISALPDGIYYYTLSVNGTIQATSKLVVIR